MQRDANLIRQIALATEALSPGTALQGLPDVEPAVFTAHVAWMLDADLVVAEVSRSLPAPNGAMVYRLTWTGCDFLDAAREPTLWSKAMSSVLRPGASWTFDILTDWLKAEIREGFPTLRHLA